MNTYRVPVEFQAENDEAARTTVEAWARFTSDQWPLSNRIVVEELGVERSYWARVESDKAEVAST